MTSTSWFLTTLLRVSSRKESRFLPLRSSRKESRFLPPDQDIFNISLLDPETNDMKIMEKYSVQVCGITEYLLKLGEPIPQEVCPAKLTLNPTLNPNVNTRLTITGNPDIIIDGHMVNIICSEEKCRNEWIHELMIYAFLSDKFSDNEKISNVHIINPMRGEFIDYWLPDPIKRDFAKYLLREKR
jgi:hypothetical protein